jgi:hypothetical protein
MRIIVLENYPPMLEMFSNTGEVGVCNVISRYACCDSAGKQPPAMVFFAKASTEEIPAKSSFGLKHVYMSNGFHLEDCWRTMIKFRPNKILFGHPSQISLLDLLRLLMCLRLPTVTDIYMDETMEAVYTQDREFVVLSSKCRSQVAEAKELSFDSKPIGKTKSFVHYDLRLLRQLKPTIASGQRFTVYLFHL